YAHHLGNPALRRLVAPGALAASRSSVGAALAAARTVPAPAGLDLVGAAKAAFVHGSNVANVVAALVAVGGAVLAVRYLPGMSRRPEAVSFPAGVEAVYGDLDDPASIRAAFVGVDRAFVMSAQPPGSAEHPTHELLLVDAARHAGVSHVVLLSVYDGGGGDDVIGAWNREAEAAVAGSGLDWTLLRPGRFMSNALQWAPMIVGGD